MSIFKGVVALDGHDGSGKTRLARLLADAVAGSYQRPFGGRHGVRLLEAADQGDVKRTVALGEAGIRRAIAAAGTRRPVVLDRGWITVASLVDFDDFAPLWECWMPTVVCWADLDTTLARLALRTEVPAPTAIHAHYLKTYWALARRSSSYVLRTDLNTEDECVERLVAWLQRVTALGGVSLAAKPPTA